MKKALFSLLKIIALIGRKINLHKQTIIREIFNSLLSRLKPTFILIHNHKMFLDVNDSLRLSIYGEFEPVERIFFASQVRKGDIVVDIGAHIGYYTLLAARLVGPRGKVYAFEANKDRFSILVKNVKQNGYKNVICINKAVYDRNDKVKLPVLFDKRIITVEALSLDDFFKHKRDSIDVIKMDIDGSETKAIKGMVHILKDNPKIKLFTEFWPLGQKEFGSSGKVYLQTLKQFGFRFYNIDEERKNIELSEENELLKRYTVKKANWTNLFCVKQDYA